MAFINIIVREFRRVQLRFQIFGYLWSFKSDRDFYQLNTSGNLGLSIHFLVHFFQNFFQLTTSNPGDDYKNDDAANNDHRNPNQVLFPRISGSTNGRFKRSTTTASNNIKNNER